MVELPARQFLNKCDPSSLEESAKCRRVDQQCKMMKSLRKCEELGVIRSGPVLQIVEVGEKGVVLEQVLLSES